MDALEVKFKEWAKENRLRLTTDEQGLPIVVRRGKRFAKDHLFDGFTDGIGFSITRPSAHGVNIVMRQLESLGIMVKDLGRAERNVFIPWSKALEVARMFKFVKGAPSKHGFKPRPSVDL